MYYCDSEEGEDPEVHHSVWTWLVSAMEVVGGDEPAAEDGAAELAGRGGRGGQGQALVARASWSCLTEWS